MSELKQILSPDKEIKILKWIIHKGSQISNGSVLCLFQSPSGSDKVERLKNTACGLVKKLLCKEGTIIAKNSPIVEITECLHTTIIKDLCADCGADLEQIDIASSSKASVPMIHSVPELKVSESLAKKLGRADTDRLLHDKKLVLLVDLDQTLIHTTNDNVPNNLKDVYHFQLYGPTSPWYHTRLRPGTLTFLKNIDPLYELHICTFGARNYAHMICAFLDENGRLFSHRILSRDECLNATSKKDNLKALFPDSCGDAMVCIIDDREDVWNHATNLIQVKPYHFFQHTGDINAPPGLAKRELDGKGVDFNKIKLQKIKKKVDKKDGKVESSKDKNVKPEVSKKKTEKVEDSVVKNEDIAGKADDSAEKIEDSDDKIEIPAEKTEDSVENSEDSIEKPEDPIKKPENSIEKPENSLVKPEVPIEKLKKSIKKLESSTEACEISKDNSKVSKENTEITKQNSEIKENSEIIKENFDDSKENSETSTENSENSTENSEKTDIAGEKGETVETDEADDGSKTPPPQAVDAKDETKDETDDNLVEIQDPDDYLLYLESILKLIHVEFYKIYEKKKEIPDLKQLVPKLKSQVLVGVKIVFSGLVPNIIKLERSRPYLIAKNLGADVTENITETTTHLVAASTGTQKVFQAQKNKKIQIVTPDWLWTCSERWEHVDEKLYPLSTSKTHKMRQVPAHCSPDRVPEPDDVKFNNPYFQMSDCDIADMEAEVEDTTSESESDNVPPEAERPSRKRRRSGEKEPEKPPVTVDIRGNGGEDENSDQSGKSGKSSDEDEEESPSAKFRRGEEISSEFEIDSNDSVDSVEDPGSGDDDGAWNMMGAALEREFLGMDE